MKSQVIASATCASVRRDLLALAVFLSLILPLSAQDATISVPGTQVATEQTAAAAQNSDALRKRRKNLLPASLEFPTHRTTITSVLARTIANRFPC
jgi:hypothetical protein